MQLYKFKEFLKLPNGIVFSYYKPCVFKGLFIKKESWESDFIYQDLIAPIKNSGSEEYNDIVMNAKEGTEIELDYEDDNTQREGLYDEEQLYAVYSKDEINKMITLIK